METVGRDWAKVLRKMIGAQVARSAWVKCCFLRRALEGHTQPCISSATSLVPVPCTACFAFHPWRCPCYFLLMQTLVLRSPWLGVPLPVISPSSMMVISVFKPESWEERYSLLVKWSESNIPLNCCMCFWQEDLKPADQSQVQRIVTVNRNRTEYGHPNGYLLKLSSTGEQIYFGKA